MSSIRTGLFSGRSSQSAPDQLPDFHDYLAIKNLLSLYCVALDTKDFDLLHEVFTDDVEASYPFANTFGVAELALRISRRLTSVTTQHALTTQHVNFPPPAQQAQKKRTSTKGPVTASVMTYFTATHFGKGQWAGNTLTAYGKYIDELVKLGDQGEPYDDVGGGHWKISRREVMFMARIGDERITGN